MTVPLEGIEPRGAHVFGSHCLGRPDSRIPEIQDPELGALSKLRRRHPKPSLLLGLGVLCVSVCGGTPADWGAAGGRGLPDNDHIKP